MTRPLFSALFVVAEKSGLAKRDYIDSKSALRFFIIRVVLCGIEGKLHDSTVQCN